MRQVHMADNLVEAHFVKGLLAAQGIAAKVCEEDMIGSFPSVWVVEEETLELAQRLVLAFSRGQVLAETRSEPWYCSRCREQIEPQFTECWKCYNLYFFSQ